MYIYRLNVGQSGTECLVSALYPHAWILEFVSVEIQRTNTQRHTHGFTFVGNVVLIHSSTNKPYYIVRHTQTHTYQKKKKKSMGKKSYYDHSGFIPGERQTKHNQSLWPVSSW